MSPPFYLSWRHPYLTNPTHLWRCDTSSYRSIAEPFEKDKQRLGAISENQREAYEGRGAPLRRGEAFIPEGFIPLSPPFFVLVTRGGDDGGSELALFLANDNLSTEVWTDRKGNMSLAETAVSMGGGEAQEFSYSVANVMFTL